MEPHEGPDGLDVPPPPYSETDIYSHSHGSRSQQLHGADDDVSIAPSSSHSNIIDTPPESPHDAQFNSAGPGSNSQHITASAQDYFDSRPPNRRPGPNITIVVEVTPDAVPSDFPLPHWAADHDVSEQDWQTFINYLIPGHAARTNSHIIDRKLRAEGDATSSSVDDGVARAQLTPLKSSPSVSVSPQNTEAVTREWNQGFFEPRGVTIHSVSPIGPPAASETQERGTSRASPADPEHGQSPPPQQSNSWWRQQPGSWWRNPSGFIDGNNGSLRLGPLHIEGDRVALGSRFEADRNGVRWRGQPNTHPLFEASSGGVRWGEQPSPHPHPPGHQTGTWAGLFGATRGRGREHGRGYGRGRRDHSRSSTSSSSSSSSSDSDSSIGSLPDYHDLKDVQLPITKHAVQDWLSHPEQPITKAMLKQAGAEIKAAKNVPPPPYDPSWDRSREALRREVKDLLQQFKALKRQQKAARRRSRKEARQQKRASRRERREHRRSERHDRRAYDHESRRAERASRRAERDAERYTRRSRAQPMTPPVPPSVPGDAPAPSFAAFPGRFAGPMGRGGFLGHRPSPPTGFGGFRRGGGGGGVFGDFRGGRGRARGLESHHGIIDRANRAAAEAVSAAEQQRVAALMMAEQQRAAAVLAAGEHRRAAAAVAEESRRGAAKVAEESRRMAAEAVVRAAVESKLAQARALESQIEVLEARIAAAEEKMARGDKKSEKRDGDAHRDREAVEQLEDEMELLCQKVETLRFEADEEMAKGLAEGEGGW
ncbi:hypothetical protein F5Y03DRAFT_188426 [Xylaria venustula]|nr:hypothetical protein F5Y03DRAFT_188426 [Xylaria venustula]